MLFTASTIYLSASQTDRLARRGEMETKNQNQAGGSGLVSNIAELIADFLGDHLGTSAAEMPPYSTAGWDEVFVLAMQAAPHDIRLLREIFRQTATCEQAFQAYL